MPVPSVAKSVVNQYWPVLDQWSALNQYWSDVVILPVFGLLFGQYWFSTDQVSINTDQYWSNIDFLSVLHNYVFVRKTIYFPLKLFFGHSLIIVTIDKTLRVTDQYWSGSKIRQYSSVLIIYWFFSLFCSNVFVRKNDLFVPQNNFYWYNTRY